jgi:hypothetical protein
MRHTVPADAHRALADENASSDRLPGIDADRTRALGPHRLDALADRLVRLEPRLDALEPRGLEPGPG